MKRRYPIQVEGDNGWTEWLSPLHGQGDRNYRLACCDCGLVHEMQFRVREGGGRTNVVFRARRNNRATAAMRRAKRYAQRSKT